jgi:hypothetical protein
MSKLKSAVLEFQSDRLFNLLDGFHGNMVQKRADLRTMKKEMKHDEQGWAA